MSLYINKYSVFFAHRLRKKVRGNWWFSREEYIFAAQCYKKAIQYLDYNESDDVEQAVSIF